MFISCLSPKRITNPYTNEDMYVPCGRCDACLNKRSTDWTTRLQIEASNWHYCIFFTLTYSDEFLPYIDVTSWEIDDPLYDYEFIKSLEECSNLVSFYDGKVPTFSTRDIQLFIKKLRKQLSLHESEEKDAFLRYYVASEYGPTTFRPHYHGLLFSNSEYLARFAKDLIPKSWSYYDSDKHSSKPLGFVDVQHVTSDACRYCAQYVTSLSHLPRLLRHKLFRPRAYFSKWPPLGTLQVKDAQIQKIFHGGLPTFSYRQPNTQKIVTVPLWRTFRNRLFPKCKGYSDLSSYDRIIMYGLAASPRFSKDCDSSLARLYSAWYKNDLKIKEFKLCIDLFGVYSPDGRKVIDETSFKNAWYLSKRVLGLCFMFNVTLEYYVSRIELFYQNSDYSNLKRQLMSEKEYLEQVPHLPISHLPTLIDKMFLNNQRNLPVFTYDDYLTQFDTTYDTDVFTSRPYLDMKFFSSHMVNNVHKTRAKNWYLENNPRFKVLHNNG